MKISKLVLMTATVMALGAGPAAAATYTYDFGALLTPSGAIQPSATFATLSVTTTNNTGFLFDLKANNLDAIFGSGAFITTLFVNTLSGADASSVTTLSTGYSLEKGTDLVVLKTTNVSNKGGVDWEFTDVFCGTQGSNTCSQSNSDNRRLGAFEQMRWTTTFAAAQVDPFFGIPAFGLKVQGITLGNEGSATYTPATPIPEPEIYAMMGLGLGLMGWVGRRRRQQGA